MSKFSTSRKLIFLSAVILGQFLIAQFPTCAQYSITATEPLEDARKMAQNNKPAQAEQILQNLYAKNPNNPAVISDLIDIYIQLGKTQEAKRMLKAYATKNTGNSRYYTQYAKVKLAEFKYQEAEATARKALELNRKNADACIVLGNTYYEMSRVSNNYQELIDNSLYYFKRAMSYNDANAEAHIGIAKVYFTTGQKEKSYDEMLKAYELGLDNLNSLFTIGIFYSENGEYEKALNSFKRYLELAQTDNEKVHLTMGEIYEKLGELDKARTEYFKVININGFNVEAKKRIYDLIKFQSPQPKASTEPTNDNLVHVSDKVQDQSLDYQIAQIEYDQIVGKLKDAYDSIKNILAGDKSNPFATAALAEMYYLKWLNGEFDSTNFYNDILTLENSNDKIVSRISRLKFDIVNRPEIPQKTLQTYYNIASSTSDNMWDKLNAVRAGYLIGNYTLSEQSLSELMSYDIDGKDMFHISYLLYCDRNYYAAQKTIKQTLNDLIKVTQILEINDRIRFKIKQSDSVTDVAINMLKKKNLSLAMKLFEKSLTLFPANKRTNYLYALALKEQGLDEQAYRHLDTYAKIEEIYPSAAPLIKEKKLKALLEEWKPETDRT